MNSGCGSLYRNVSKRLKRLKTIGISAVSSCAPAHLPPITLSLIDERSKAER